MPGTALRKPSPGLTLSITEVPLLREVLCFHDTTLADKWQQSGWRLAVSITADWTGLSLGHCDTDHGARLWSLNFYISFPDIPPGMWVSDSSGVKHHPLLSTRRTTITKRHSPNRRAFGTRLPWRYSSCPCYTQQYGTVSQRDPWTYAPRMTHNVLWIFHVTLTEMRLWSALHSCISTDDSNTSGWFKKNNLWTFENDDPVSPSLWNQAFCAALIC